jgi:hypothetical protein
VRAATLQRKISQYRTSVHGTDLSVLCRRAERLERLG